MPPRNSPTCLLVSDVTQHGGTTKYLCQTVTAAHSAGWKCHVILDDGRQTDQVARQLADHGTDLTRRPLYPGHHSEQKIVDSMRSTLAEVRPAIVHATSGSIKSCIIPREVTLQAGIPLVCTEGYVSRLTEVSPDHLCRLRRIHAQASAVIVVAQENRVLLCQRLGIQPQRLFVIPNAVCLPTSFRTPHTTPPRKIVTVTRFTSQKGMDTLLTAFSLLSERMRSQVQLTMIGEGELRDQLTLQARDLGLDNRCLRFEGWRDDIPELLSEYDLFVLPSRAEGQPFSLIEALVERLPCIATWVSGNPEVLMDGCFGGLVAPDDPVALSAALERFLDHPERLRLLSCRASAHLRTHHDVALNMNRVLTIWEQAIAQSEDYNRVRALSLCPARLASEIARVLVVIVSTDDASWLSPCLAALEESSFQEFRVLLIDNCCTDKTSDIAAASPLAIRCLRADNRLSYAEANNLGFQEAALAGFRYVMLLNPDTRIHRDGLRTLVDFLDSQYPFGIAGSWQCTYEDDTWTRPNEWTRQMLANASHEGLEPRTIDAFTVLESSYVQGAALMIRVGLLTRIGWLDTVYGTFYEETDLCRRCRLEGSRVGLIFQSLVRHEEGGHWRRSVRRNRWRDYLYLRNQLLYELSEPHRGLLPLVRLWKIVRGQLYSLRHGNDRVALPLWHYPRVLAGLLLRISFLKDLRTRNRAILNASAVPENLRCVGPRADRLPKGER